jgi:hypothetical protein
VSEGHRTWISSGPASAFGARPMGGDRRTLFQAVCESCGRLGNPCGAYDDAKLIRELHELELEQRGT